MSKIFDNIETRFLDGLHAILTNVGVERVDFCVGYFNLRGWKHVAEDVALLPGGNAMEKGTHGVLVPVKRFCRLLVGMQRPNADLIREMNIPLEVETMTASSYGAATVSSGVVNVVSKLDSKIIGRHVVLVEDIVDSGRTLAFIKSDMSNKGVLSLKVCSLLDKPSRRVADLVPDYAGFEVPDEFVVGYGLDYDQKYRNLPEIGVLKSEIYQSK